jgi:hypothetical protein
MPLAILVVSLWIIAPVLLYLIGALAAAIVEGRLPFVRFTEETGAPSAKTGPDRDAARS